MQKNKIIEEIIRVNHAGEYGAKRIYQGQLAIFRNFPIYQEIKAMQIQEEKHLKYFEDEMIKNQVRPSFLSPLWSASGYLLGIVTATMEEKAAMACTEAVEEVICDHYMKQIEMLEDSKLKDKIIEFRNDELEHYHTAIDSGSIEAPMYSAMTNVIKFGCRLAIKIAKKI